MLGQMVMSPAVLSLLSLLFLAGGVGFIIAGVIQLVRKRSSARYFAAGFGLLLLGLVTPAIIRNSVGG